MALMAAFGFMNLRAMAALAMVIAIEKLWSRGDRFARLTGVAAFGLAIIVIFEPGLDEDGRRRLMAMT